MVSHKNVTENTARSSAPKKDRIEIIFGKVVSEIRAQSTFGRSFQRDDANERFVNKKFDNGSQNTVKKLHSKNDSIKGTVKKMRLKLLP